MAPSLVPSFTDPVLTDLTGSWEYVKKIRADVTLGDTSFSVISHSINVGSAHNLLSKQFCAQLLQLHSQLNFTHIRILELVSNSFIPMVLPDYDYYFQNVDRILSFLFEHGLAPWIELSRLPQLSTISGVTNHFFHTPRDSRYYKLFTRFLSHVAGHWPSNWTRKWRFELWFSPADQWEAYFQDFEKLQQLIQKYLPGASFGGPGCSSLQDGHDQETGILPFIQGFQQHNLFPDFFSLCLSYEIPGIMDRASLTHSAEDNSKTRISLHPDPDYLKKAVVFANQTLQELLPHTPLYISEWTSGSILDLPVSSSRYQAAFICRSLLQLGPWCEDAAYWLLSDVPHSRGMLHPQEFYYFGQGLFNREGIPTAACFAYELFHRLNGRIIYQEEHCLITRADQNHYQVLGFHYAHFSAASCFPENETMAFEQVNNFFQESSPLALSIELEHLLPGTYLISRTLINHEQGSILDIIIGEFNHSNLDRIEFLKNIKSPSQEELRYRLSSCIPQERRVFLQSQGKLTLETTLSAHDICLWDIRRQV